MLKFEYLKTEVDIHKLSIYRAKVPGGWLVLTTQYQSDYQRSDGSTFIPDPEHQWDGASLS